jgi:RNA recognition motif-containing protein
VNEDTLVRFFRNNGVKALRAKIPRNEYGRSQNYAFVLLLNDGEKGKALAMSNQVTLENRVLSIDESRKPLQKKRW